MLSVWYVGIERGCFPSGLCAGRPPCGAVMALALFAGCVEGESLQGLAADTVMK